FEAHAGVGGRRVAFEGSAHPTRTAGHTLMNTFRRYIQYRISHSTVSVTAPCTSGAYSGPNTWNVRTPRCRHTMLRISGLMNDVLMQYAAIEFVPTTTSGNAHPRHPITSLTA